MSIAELAGKVYVAEATQFALVLAMVTAWSLIIAVLMAELAIAVVLELAGAVTGPVNAALSKLEPFSVMEVEPV